MAVNMSLEQLLASNRHIWRGRSAIAPRNTALDTGFDDLNALLPERGWPADSLVESIVPHWGIGELQLFLPVMVNSTAQGRWLAWIAPPHIPYAPALVGSGIRLDRLLLLQPPRQEDIPWAMEKLLRQPRCAMVLAWPERLKPVVVRRLQLAAEAGKTLGVLFYSKDNGSSPAALRLRLSPAQRGINLDILKSRASFGRQSVTLSFE